MPPDREMRREPGGPDEETGRPTATSKQAFQGESNTEDSLGLLFSVYSNAAKYEDDKMAERWQQDAKGILIFTGLFSAAVAALLAVTVPDLRPSSQDTSAFHLGNIYQVLANPNTTRTVAIPPPFSPPRSAIWVNSLWFLSLVMSLSCALLATLLQQWARQYLSRAQPARCSPEKRARMRAFFVEGVEKMHILWAVEGLPMLLHLSLFLFFGGVAVFLFNLNREVFGYVTGWIGLFSLVYGLITVLPIARYHSPYHSPLSTSAWLLCTAIRYATTRILLFITRGKFGGYGNVMYWDRGEYHYRGWMSGSMEKAAEEAVKERSSEIDVQILEWTLSALGDDDSLKTFFEAIPRSFNSKMLGHLKRDLPSTLRKNITSALYNFCDRTLSSDSISDAEKVRRLDISNNALDPISGGHCLIPFLSDHLRLEDMPQTIEMGNTIARWMTSRKQDIVADAQCLIIRILINVRDRNHSWAMLAARVFGLSELYIRDNIALGGDTVFLAIFIHIARDRYLIIPTGDWQWSIFLMFFDLDIVNTHLSVQHDFCTLWNQIAQKIAQKVTSRRMFTPDLYFLKSIRHFYIALHQGTNAAPTAFSASTGEDDRVLNEPSSYPFCKLTKHLQNSTPHISVTLPSSGDTASQQAEQAQNVVEPPGTNLTAPTNPAHSSSPGRPTGATPTAVVGAASQDITSTATIVAPSAESSTNQLLSTTSTHPPAPTPAPIPTSLPNTTSESYGAGVVSVSAQPLHFPSPEIGSPIPAFRPIGSATLPRLRARGLVNTKNICFVNAVLQILANSPPFWNLFRELVDLNRQRGTNTPETGGGATPLVDASVRFFQEYVEDQLQPDTGVTPRANEENREGVVDSFEPTYLYGAMKEKRQLKPLLDGQQQDVEEFLCLYFETLDKELTALLSSISSLQSSAALDTEEHEMSQSNQTEAGRQDYIMNSVKSPITHIFGGKFHSPVRTPDQPDAVPAEDWRSLHLDIQSDSVVTIQDALMGIFRSQSMQDDPSGLSNARRQILIERLPPILVLHLKRFQYPAAAGGVVKIGKYVQLSSELGIPFDIMVPNADAQRPSEPPQYKLYGVLYHHGESAGSGHYTVDVLHPNGDGNAGEVWLHIDDEVVTRIRHEDVFGEGEQVADKRCAYLLFYCRTSPVGSS